MKDRPRNTLNTRKENGEESLLGFGHYLELGINCSGMLFVRVSSEVGRLKKDRPRKGSVSALRRIGVCFDVAVTAPLLADEDR
jgi:hypothetical protein